MLQNLLRFVLTFVFVLIGVIVVHARNGIHGVYLMLAVLGVSALLTIVVKPEKVME